MIRAVLLSLSLLALAACAPVIQSARQPPMGFKGPRLDEDRVISFDGASLGLTTWKAKGGEPWAVIVGVHGMNDYAGEFREAGPYWAKDGITTYAYDQRGFGRSPNRGVWPGEGLMKQDLRTVVTLVRAKHPHAVIGVVGESMGSAVGITAFASNRPPPADRLIVLSPAVWGWSTQPLPQKASAWLAARTLRSRSIEPPRFVTKKIMATDNIEHLRAMSRDPNMIFNTRFDAINGILDLMESAWRKTGKIKVPTAYFYGQRDDIIPPEPTFEAAARLKRTDRTAYYPRGYHLLLVDLQAENVWKDVESFLRDPTAPLPSGAPPIPRPGQSSGKIVQNTGSRAALTLAPASGASDSATRQ